MVKSHNLYQTIPTLFQQWSISLDILPTGIVEHWGNILRVGLGGHWEDYGDRTPLINFTPNDTKLHIQSAINGQAGYGFTAPALPLHEWTHVEISQLVLPDSAYHLVLFTIRINNSIFVQMNNTDPIEFSDITVWASDQFHTAARARIDNLTIYTFSDNGE